jgi:hypothetical protein
VRQVAILRDVTHVISPSPDRPDRPGSAAEAQARLESYLQRLQAEAPRTGLGAADGHFVDHVVKLSRRYGSHLFVCFDDPRIPSTTDELEGFFGQFKSFVKRVTGRGSTANGLVQSLGDSLLRAFHDVKNRRILPGDLPVDASAFRDARQEITKAEAPARRRRSLVRSLDRNLEHLVTRRQALATVSAPLPSQGLAAGQRARL